MLFLLVWNLLKDIMYIFLYKTDNAALTKLLMIIIFIFSYNTLHPLQKQPKKGGKGIALDILNTACHFESMNVLVRLHQAHWQRFSHWKLS